MSRPQPPPQAVYDSEPAWNELYDTLDGQAPLPPPPQSPRSRRRRRRGLLVLALLVMAGGALAGAIWVSTQQVTALLRAIATSDETALRDQVDWPALGADLSEQLAAMARAAQQESLHGAPPSAPTARYLSGLIAATVAGQSHPDGLAATLRLRASPNQPQVTPRDRDIVLPAVGAVTLGRWPTLSVELPGNRQAFPSGVGLCLRLLEAGVPRARLVRLIWPEARRPC